MSSTSATTKTLFDSRVVKEAERRAEDAIRDLLSPAQGPRAVVVAAPAGAGKTQQVTNAVSRARDRRLRVAVATPTNEQAFGLVRRIAAVHCRPRPGETVSFLPASTIALPADVRGLPEVRVVDAAGANHEALVVGTLSKLGDAFGRGDLQPFDVLLIDESYQADSSKYFAVGDLAPLHLLVGDSGQISPFTTIDDPCRWRGLPEDPLQTAVGVLLRNHPGTPVHGLPITRRLDGRAARMAKFFYPNLRFDAAVLPGVRRLALRGVPAARPRVGRLDHALDHALDLAARDGWAHLLLPRAPVLPADPEAIDLIVTLIARLFARSPRVSCERLPGPVELGPARVAVGVSHNDQKDLLRAALAARGLSEVVVETANKLQGLEFELVVVWHPLAGLAEPDGFHLDPGRLCVLLTRHRQACLVVGREGDDELLKDQLPPPTPAYLGWDPDPVLDGWEVHREVFAALETCGVSV
jgi:hypothetical protein